MEPPSAPTLIPFVGHIVGLARNKFNYYGQLSKSCKSPIFTVSIPGQKFYVVTKPELVQLVQKQYMVLAFPSVAARIVPIICGSSPRAQEIINHNTNGEEGDWGVSVEANAGMRNTLKMGPDLDYMTRLLVADVARAVDMLKPDTQKTTTIALHGWLRKTMTAVTTDAVYGPKNPFKDPSIADAFWGFQSGLMTLMVGFLPSLLARSTIASRDKFVKAFEAYFANKDYEDGTAFSRMRFQTQNDNGMPIEDIARHEIGAAIGILVNTVPAAFWTLLLIYSHPNLLDQIRAEVDAVTTTHTENNQTTRALDLTRLKESCPLLLSTFQETLRYRSIGMSVRDVLEDTILDGQWLLKKGSMVHIPSRVIHQDPSLWGADAEEFRPRRFMKDEPHQTANGQKPRDMYFRAFGGGKVLCPGRHFATNEILTIVSLFISQFDMVPQNDSGWKLPTALNSNMASVIMEPDTDVEVEISRRKDYQEEDGVRWIAVLKKSDKVFALVAEDKEE